MSSNRQSGDQGERKVIKLVPCPNCGKKLMALPPNYPLYDVQCTACNFRAQIKTNNTRPHNEIFGATWEIINKVLKAGFLVPPLFVIFQWTEKGQKSSEIRFYPFIPKDHLRKRKTRIKKSGRRLTMFNYRAIHQIPHFIYTSSGWQKV